MSPFVFPSPLLWSPWSPQTLPPQSPAQEHFVGARVLFPLLPPLLPPLAPTPPWTPPATVLRTVSRQPHTPPRQQTREQRHTQEEEDEDDDGTDENQDDENRAGPSHRRRMAQHRYSVLKKVKAIELYERLNKEQMDAHDTRLQFSDFVKENFGKIPNIDGQLFSKWYSSRDKLKAALKEKPSVGKKLSLHAGFKPQYADFEKLIVDDIVELRTSQTPVAINTSAVVFLILRRQPDFLGADARKLKKFVGRLTHRNRGLLSFRLIASSATHTRKVMQSPEVGIP